MRLDFPNASTVSLHAPPKMKKITPPAPKTKITKRTQEVIENTQNQSEEPKPAPRAGQKPPDCQPTR
jgi:hypothetical protein